MNKTERLAVVKSMETLARCVNHEGIFERWLVLGVADGDGDSDEDLEFYTEDGIFKELMTLFLGLMSFARVNGGLYSDGITSDEVPNKARMYKKALSHLEDEMIKEIESSWESCGFAETGMDSDEASVFLGYDTSDMEQDEIDNAVSEIQLAYYTEREADFDEIVEKYLECFE